MSAETFVTGLTHKFLNQLASRDTEDVLDTFLSHALLRSSDHLSAFGSVPEASKPEDAIYRLLGENFVTGGENRYEVTDISTYTVDGDDVIVSACIVAALSLKRDRLAGELHTGFFRLSLVWVKTESLLGYQIAHLHASEWTGLEAEPLGYHQPTVPYLRPYLPQVTKHTNHRPPYPRSQETPMSEAFVRDAIRISFGLAQSSIWWILDGWTPDVESWGVAKDADGGISGQVANYAETAEHYIGLFAGFAPEFSLVSDNAIVAGPFLIQSYHASARVKVAATNEDLPGYGEKNIIFHGQTIYRVNADGKIDWRWSNHYNEIWQSQFKYWTEHCKDSPAKDWLPDSYFLVEKANALPNTSTRDAAAISELYLRDSVFRMFGYLNHPATRDMFFSWYSSDCRFYSYKHAGTQTSGETRDLAVSGIQASYPLGIASRLSTYARALSQGYAAIDETVVVGNYVGISWHYAGFLASNRGQPAIVREQLIMRFDKDTGKIVEQWENPDLAHNSQFIP